MTEEDVIVNDKDELFHTSHDHEPPRKLGEYKVTNLPLSQAEIKRDEARDTHHEGWGPRTTKNIGDMTPLPEKPVPASDID